jgi:hypothetical protein
MHIRQARHQELVPTVDSLCTFRNVDASRRSDGGDAATFHHYCLMSNDTLPVHWNYAYIDKRDGSLLR